VDKDQEIADFIKDIKNKFPAVAVRIDKWIERMGCDPEDKMYTCMMEAFLQATTDAIKEYDEQSANAHLTYMSEKLKKASVIEHEYIDVYYVESLMWDIKDEKNWQWGWKLIPENLKELYKGIWGEPDF
jgi:hypothetical protein